jgi:rhodanese-related sulfurtransferase
MDPEVPAAKSSNGRLQMETRPISRPEVLARLNDSSLILLNVMPKETFETAHIPHSINLPVAEIYNRARKVLPQLDREIIVYCMGPT